MECSEVKVKVTQNKTTPVKYRYLKNVLKYSVRIERGRFKSSRLYARYRESRERKQEQVGREKKGETHGVVGWNEAETQLMENV